MQFGVVVTDALGQLTACTQVRVLLEHSFEAATLVFFAAPMTLMCVLYALIAGRLHRQRKEAVGQSTPSLRHVAAKKRVIKMLGECMCVSVCAVEGEGHARVFEPEPTWILADFPRPSHARPRDAHGSRQCDGTRSRRGAGRGGDRSEPSRRARP